MNVDRSLLGGILSGLAMTGVLLMIAGTRQVERHPAPPRPRKAATVDVRVVAVAVLAGVTVGVWSGWWSIGAGLVIGGWFVPKMTNERRGQRDDRVRVAALASWVEAVRDLLSAASGIEEAIARSGDALPFGSPIFEPVLVLRATTEAHGLREGLRRFGELLDDPIGDYVCASLLIASERASGQVHQQLTDAAGSARDQVAIRERVEASRSRMWLAANGIVGVSAVMILFILATQPAYATWYASPTGQLILTATTLVEIGGLWAMARIGRPDPGPRIPLIDPPPTLTFTTNAGLS